MWSWESLYVSKYLKGLDCVAMATVDLMNVNGWMTVCFLDSVLHVVEAFVAVQWTDCIMGKILKKV